MALIRYLSRDGGHINRELRNEEIDSILATFFLRSYPKCPRLAVTNRRKNPNQLLNFNGTVYQHRVFLIQQPSGGWCGQKGHHEPALQACSGAAAHHRPSAKGLRFRPLFRHQPT